MIDALCSMPRHRDLLLTITWRDIHIKYKQSIMGILWAVLKYLLIVVLMIIIKNTNPRVRIDAAVRFFWRIAAPLAFVAVILAVLGV